MRIWLVTVGEEIPSDPGTPRLLRTGILARQLAERGHDVTWWNSTMNHQQKLQRSKATTRSQTQDGYRLVLLYGRRYASNLSLGRLANHRDLAQSFRREASGHTAPDTIVCGYPTIELADAVVEYAHARSIPVAVDFRDMWPDAIAALLPPPVRLAASPLLAHWRTAQKRIVAHATAVIGITDAFVDWALDTAGRKRSPLDRAFHLTVDTVVPPAAARAAADAFWSALSVKENGEPTVGCFLGSIARRHDLLAVVKTAADLPAATARQLRLVFCGPPDLMRDIAAVSRGAPTIICAGWRNAAEVRCLLERSHFGLLPYPSTPDFRMSLPNKVGEYLSAGLPIMTGLKGETHALLSRAGIGLFYEETDIGSIGSRLQDILAHRDHLAALRPKALSTYQAEFDAATIYADFADYIESLVAFREVSEDRTPITRERWMG